MPPSAARSMMAADVVSSHCSPKVMVPRQSLETCRPVLPSRTWSMRPTVYGVPSARCRSPGSPVAALLVRVLRGSPLLGFDLPGRRPGGARGPSRGNGSGRRASPWPTPAGRRRPGDAHAVVVGRQRAQRHDHRASDHRVDLGHPHEVEGDDVAEVPQGGQGGLGAADEGSAARRARRRSDPRSRGAPR